jgi:hypothetical protein
MVYFQNKNSNLGKVWRALEWKYLVYLEYFTAIWYFLCPISNVVVCNLVYFSPLSILCQQKSENPAPYIQFCVKNRTLLKIFASNRSHRRLLVVHFTFQYFFRDVAAVMCQTVGGSVQDCQITYSW